ncbi:MAG: Gfo/Idh/MocA family oxidoreductase [Pseudomonadota bacterium]
MATTDLLKVGLIGAGRIAERAHIGAVVGSPLAELTAIVDRDRSRAQWLADEYRSQALVAEDLQMVLNHIDAAIIATPNDTHFALARICLEAGKAVLVEKPIASSTLEAQGLVELAENNGLILAGAYTTRFRDSMVVLEQLLRDQTFGPAKRFINRLGIAGGWSPVSVYNLDRDVAGGGVLAVVGTHFLDRMLHFWGYPKSMRMIVDALDRPESNCRCSFEFTCDEQQISGLATYSKTASVAAGTVIETTEGLLALGEFDESDLFFFPHENPSIKQIIAPRHRPVFEPGVESYALQFEDFAMACINGTPPRVDGRQSALSVQLIEELYANAEVEKHTWYAREGASQ